MASRLQEYLLQQPLYAAGANASESGTSMAPVRSPWEGLARALQGGLGGVMQGYAVAQARGARKKDNDALSAHMLDPENPEKAAAASEHPDFASVTLSRLNAKERIAAAMEAQHQRAADQMAMKQFMVANRAGHADPYAAADARAKAAMDVLDHKAKLEAEARNNRMAGGFDALPLPGEGAPTMPAAQPAPPPGMPQLRLTPMRPDQMPEKRADAMPPGVMPANAQGQGDSVPPVQQAQADPYSAPGSVEGGGDPASPPQLDMTGRTDYQGVPVSNALMQGVIAAKRAKNEVLAYRLHQEMVKEAITHRHQQMSAKDFAPVLNSQGVQVGQRNNTTGQENFYRGGSPEGFPLTDTAQKRLSTLATPAKELEQLHGSAPSKVGGYGAAFIGDTVNMLKLKVIGDDPEGEAQWWQRYDATANLQRNVLFGSALTAHEIAAWNKAMVNTGMLPEAIKANLARQAAIAKIVASRAAHSLAAQGANPSAIEAEIGYKLKDLPSPFSVYADPVAAKPAASGASGASGAATPSAPSGDAAGVLDRARAAIASGKPRDKVIERLKSLGVTPPDDL